MADEAAVARKQCTGVPTRSAADSSDSDLEDGTLSSSALDHYALSSSAALTGLDIKCTLSAFFQRMRDATSAPAKAEAVY
jgi:hypothetical protein